MNPTRRCRNTFERDNTSGAPTHSLKEISLEACPVLDAGHCQKKWIDVIVVDESRMLEKTVNTSELTAPLVYGFKRRLIAVFYPKQSQCSEAV